MGIQMTIPFTVLQNGAVSVESDQNVQVAQRVNAIVSTEIGQRAMRATMGLPLSQLLFDPNNSLVAARLKTLVATQLSIYEPGIQLLSVTQNTNESNNGLAAINVTYSPLLAASTTSAVANVVTIEVGGTVKGITVNGNS